MVSCGASGENTDKSESGEAVAVVIGTRPTAAIPINIAAAIAPGRKAGKAMMALGEAASAARSRANTFNSTGAAGLIAVRAR